MKHLIYILPILLTSCGQIGIQDPRFAQFVSEYAVYRHVDPSWLNITAVSKVNLAPSMPDSEVIGECILPEGQINIGLDFYENASEIQQKALIFHELEHCTLRAIHYNVIENGCPVSYMNAFIPSNYCLSKIFINDGISIKNVFMKNSLTGLFSL